jgi:nucleoside-diphosphate-sugar epimerase
MKDITRRKIMKVFITGGTGNIGQYVTLALAGNGHEAVVLSRFSVTNFS